VYCLIGIDEFSRSLSG